MITLTGLDHKEFILNAELIEKIETVPDSVITLSNGKKYLVIEPADEIVDRIIEYKRKIFTFELKKE